MKRAMETEARAMAKATKGGKRDGNGDEEGNGNGIKDV
jgi:hypothetical protein